MNRILIVSLFLLFTCAKCGDCEDCGDSSVNESKYCLVNKLDTEVSLNFYGESQLLNLNLSPNDTSTIWTRILLPPPGGSSTGFFFTRDENAPDGFPFDSDSLNILTKGKLLKNFPRNYFENDPDWKFSIYLDESPPYTIINDHDVSFYYYMIDSVNLNLN